ncbi:MAG: BrnA antitoxin family protein [Gammaproteobacteria bacterium]
MIIQFPKKKKDFSLSTELASELDRLATLSNKEIDLSDIPELDFDKLGNPVIGKFYRPTKKLISIRIDSDVLHWFKQFPQYQKLINRVCRMYMEKARAAR